MNMNDGSPTVRHNKTEYHLNLKRFLEISNYASSAISEKTPLPWPIEDCLDEASFSVLVDATNMYPQFVITHANVIHLLRASLVWIAPTFTNAAMNFLLKDGSTRLIIAALDLSDNASSTFVSLEKYVAGRIHDFILDPTFCQLPVYILMRILTWYNVNPAQLNTPNFVTFVVNVLKHSGITGTFLLNFVNIASIPIKDLEYLISDGRIDFDFMGEKILRELPQIKSKSGECKTIQVAIDAATVDKSRLSGQCDAAKRTESSWERKAKSSQSRHKTAKDEYKQAEDDFNSFAAKLQDLNNQKEDLNRQIKAANEDRDKAQRARDNSQKELETAKQKQRDWEAEQKSRADKLAARQQQKTAAKGRPAVPVQPPPQETKPVEKDPPKVETPPPPTPTPAPTPAPESVQPETKRFVKPAVPYKLDVFKKCASKITKDDIAICLPNGLLDIITEADEARTVYLDYLWRNVEMKNPESCSYYGAILAAEDFESDDLALNLLRFAADEGDPDAIFNMAVLIKQERCELSYSEDEFADLIVKAANEGHEMAQEVIRKVT